MTATDSQMPMGRAAARLALNPAEQELPPLPIVPQAAPAAATTPPSPVPPPPPTMPGAPTPKPPAGPQAGGYPAPGAPPSPVQWEIQADGSPISYINGSMFGMQGKIYLQRVDPPKVPRAFQPPTAA